MNRKYLPFLFPLLLALAIDFVLAQSRPSNKNNSTIRQYTFAALPVVDANSDSIKILSYLVVPNNVLKLLLVTFSISFNLIFLISASFSSVYLIKLGSFFFPLKGTGDK